jgi:hypothetical protein
VAAFNNILLQSSFKISNVQIQPCVTVKTEVKQKPVALTTSREKKTIKTCSSKQADQTDKNNDFIANFNTFQRGSLIFK